VTDAAARTQYLVFLLGDDEHAIAEQHLHEVVGQRPITRLPGMPAWIRGVANLRGSVLPVIDVAVRFGRGDTAIGKRTCLVVVEVDIAGERTLLGLLVDAVSRVIDVSSADIDPAPAFGNQIRVDFLRGVIKSGERFTVLLDLPRMFSADEVLDVSQRAQSAPARAAVELAASGSPPPPPADAAASEQGVVYFDD
jgi:purine-binding chemotaxis protein CheW